MICATIPKEIREYKEKLVAGLTARQFITTILAIGICVPLYIYGRRVINEELISWLVIFIAFPLGAIGFFKYNGMTAEQLFLCILKFIVFPMKRVCMTTNCLRDWQEQTKKEDLIREGIADTKGKIKRRAKKYLVGSSYERSYLLEENIRSGKIHDIKLSDLDSMLITARKLDSKARLTALNKKLSFISLTKQKTA